MNLAVYKLKELMGFESIALLNVHKVSLVEDVKLRLDFKCISV